MNVVSVVRAAHREQHAVVALAAVAHVLIELPVEAAVVRIGHRERPPRLFVLATLGAAPVPGTGMNSALLSGLDSQMLCVRLPT